MNQSTEQAEFAKRIRVALKVIKQYQRPNHLKATIQIINSFIPFIGVWILMYLTWDYSFWLCFLLSILNAFFLVRIFIIQHDCGHKTFVRSSGARKVIGYVCSLFSSIPFFYWGKSHHFHHSHNGMLEVRDIGDITTLTVEEYKNLSRWGRFKYRLYRSTFVMFFLGPIYYVLIHNRLPLIKEEGFKKEEKGLWLYNVLYAGLITALCFLLDWKKFLLIHGMILSMFSVIAIWFFYIQHQHEHAYKEWRNKWEYLYAAVKGSSYYKLPALLNWFTGNIAIHHIHHLNPTIPNYNLKKSMNAILWINKYTSEISIWQSFRLASNKLWDEATGRMITFKEFYKIQNRQQATV